MDDRIMHVSCAARFIKSPTWLIKRNGQYQVTLNAFLPKVNPSNDTYETSVWMHSSGKDIPWEEGRKFMENRKPPKGKPKPKLQGIADVAVTDIDRVGVKLDNLMGLPPFHANIIGWDNREAEQKREAQLLADKAKVSVIEENIIEPWVIKTM